MVTYIAKNTKIYKEDHIWVYDAQPFKDAEVKTGDCGDSLRLLMHITGNTVQRTIPSTTRQ